jgi:hypothetical protein
VIYLKQIEVRGEAQAGKFSGVLNLAKGLQVISARNAYGKSLAAKSVTWCLGLEPIFGNSENDPIRLPEAVREELALAGHPNSSVLSSECSIVFEDDKGRSLRITRPIKGSDASYVYIEERDVDGGERKSKLLARKLTMQDEHGGFQRFFFDWLGWPRMGVPTFRQAGAEIYLENLAPLFYIDQNEGWSTIQALQISRYGQLEIGEIAVEYLLGAMDALRWRLAKLNVSQRTVELKDAAKNITEQLTDKMLRYGWRIDWSNHGSLSDIIARWSKRTIRRALEEDASVDIVLRQKDLSTKIERLRTSLTSGPLDSNSSVAPVAASQKAIDLKKRRHGLSQDLSTFNLQLRETSSLVESIEHRLHAANDLLRLKTTGVGRLDHLECPTCHRDLDVTLFGLTSQSAESVEAHIEALKSDRELVIRNREALSASVTASIAEIAEVDTELRDAEKALMTVTEAVGAEREQLAATASELSAVERSFERLSEASSEIDEFQNSIDRWISDAKSLMLVGEGSSDQLGRKEAFAGALREYLVALGHSAVDVHNAQMVSLDEQYVPYMNGRRLRALGSASDQSRLVAAYSLALAATAQNTSGKHPGFLILDEPLQQNPDASHRELFLTFLTKQLARRSDFQTIIFTSLFEDEIKKLREKNTVVVTPLGSHFLHLEKKQEAPPAAERAQTK